MALNHLSFCSVLRVISILALSLLYVALYAQTAEVSGIVHDANGQSIPYILIWSRADTTSSNENGRFSLKVGSGDSVYFKSSLFASKVVSVHSWDSPKEIVLSTLSLAAVVVTSSPLNKDKPTFYLRPEQIAALPALGGQVDILRSLKQLPGISDESEGTSSISIRGGTPDQTLLLLDGVPVLSPAIFFGYLGAINYDIVQDLTVYTAGFPSRLGGRASGFVGVKTK